MEEEVSHESLRGGMTWSQHGQAQIPHVSPLLYVQCTWLSNIMSVAILDTLHSESESLLPLVEIEGGSNL
jgi:hypothetical protein